MNKEFPGHFQMQNLELDTLKENVLTTQELEFKVVRTKKIMIFLESSNFLISIFKNFLGKDFSYVKLF